MKLDKQQRQAVDSDAKKIIVSAGAGSGKTRVLTERVKRLLLEGVQPHNIICITFTNLASQEMKIRLKDVEGIGDAFIGTIHSLANKIMKNSHKTFQILNEKLQNETMKEILSQDYEHLSYDRYLKNLDMKEMFKLGKISEEAFKSFLNPSERDDLREAYMQLRSLCDSRNILTFDRLLEEATEYFGSIDGKIQHVLVDEFQDVGSLEGDFVFNLNAENYFLVGDDYQSIYGFKGGDVEMFKALTKDGIWTHLKLENNYRNSEVVKKIAMDVIKQVPDRIKKKVNLMSGEKGSLELKTQACIDEVLERIKKEGNFGDWFLLTRTNRDLYMMTKKLLMKDIPFDTFKKGDVTLQEIEEIMEDNTLKLLTVHTSKGLENENVILYGNFPVVVPDYMMNTDERKVMYVGLTRAKKDLIVLN